MALTQSDSPNQADWGTDPVAPTAPPPTAAPGVPTWDNLAPINTTTENLGTIYGGYDWAELERQAMMDRARWGEYQKWIEKHRPWEESSRTALGKLNDLTSGKTGPEELSKYGGYKFRLEEGLKALSRAQNARHGFFAPRALREIERYSQDLASLEYENIWSRLQNMATMVAPIAPMPAYIGAPNSPTLATMQDKYAYLYNQNQPATVTHAPDPVSVAPAAPPSNVTSVPSGPPGRTTTAPEGWHPGGPLPSYDPWLNPYNQGD